MLLLCLMISCNFSVLPKLTFPQAIEGIWMCWPAMAWSAHTVPKFLDYVMHCKVSDNTLNSGSLYFCYMHAYTAEFVGKDCFATSWFMAFRGMCHFFSIWILFIHWCRVITVQAARNVLSFINFSTMFILDLNCRNHQQHWVSNTDCWFSHTDPKQRLALFRKLEETTKLRPVHPPARKPRKDYFQGTKVNPRSKTIVLSYW